jgi:hypothetical protein
LSSIQGILRGGSGSGLSRREQEFETTRSTFPTKTLEAIYKDVAAIRKSVDKISKRSISGSSGEGLFDGMLSKLGNRFFGRRSRLGKLFRRAKIGGRRMLRGLKNLGARGLSRAKGLLGRGWSGAKGLFQRGVGAAGRIGSRALGAIGGIGSKILPASVMSAGKTAMGSVSSLGSSALKTAASVGSSAASATGDKKIRDNRATPTFGPEEPSAFENVIDDNDENEETDDGAAPLSFGMGGSLNPDGSTPVIVRPKDAPKVVFELHEARYCRACVRSPKSVALPAEAIVTYSIIFV